MDLFEDAFTAVGGTNGLVQTSWRLISCDITTPLVLRNKEGELATCSSPTALQVHQLKLSQAPALIGSACKSATATSPSKASKSAPTVERPGLERLERTTTSSRTPAVSRSIPSMSESPAPPAAPSSSRTSGPSLRLNTRPAATLLKMTELFFCYRKNSWQWGVGGTLLGR